MTAATLQPSAVSQLSTVQGLPSSQTSGPLVVQAPPAHWSPVVQASPSVQVAALNSATQPSCALQLSVVHKLPSSQEIARPGRQEPPAQLSPSVQALPSEHSALLATNTQPLAELQVSLVQTLPSSQLSAAPGVQALSTQASPVVQASPSLHGAVVATFWQPVTGWQASAVQLLPSSQLLAAPGWQALLAHASPTVQASLSVQVAVLATNTQPLAGLQLSSVQTFASSQTFAVPPTHAPLAHASPVVHKLPSEQGAVLKAEVQPVTASQVSVVHGFLSSHTEGAVGTQAPFVQVSPVVQLLKSLLGNVLLVNTQPPAAQESVVHGLSSLQSFNAPGTQTPTAH